MNAKKKPAAAPPAAATAWTETLEVAMGTSRSYGSPMPFIKVAWALDESRNIPSWRVRKARLHRLAAAVEEASLAAREGWVVNINDDSHLVYLELMMDGASGMQEAERGIAVLRQVAAKGGV